MPNLKHFNLITDIVSITINCYKAPSFEHNIPCMVFLLICKAHPKHILVRIYN